MIGDAYVLYRARVIGTAPVRDRLLVEQGTNKGPTMFQCAPALIPVPGGGQPRTLWCFVENDKDYAIWIECAAEVYACWLALYAWIVGRA